MRKTCRQARLSISAHVLIVAAMENVHASNNDIVAHARRATVPDMTIGSSISAAVRRAGEKASRQASAEAIAEASAETSAEISAEIGRMVNIMTLSWSPANDHLVVDGLETVTLTTLAATTATIYRVLRLPALVDLGSAGALTSFGNITRWNIWIQECPTAPEINALLTDAANVKYRINNVTQSVQRNMWEIETTADAGVGL